MYDVKGRFTVHRINPEEAKVVGARSLCVYVCVGGGLTLEGRGGV